MSSVTLEELLSRPPLRTTTMKLEDGRSILVFELPVSVIDRVRTMGEDDEVSMDDVTYVVAFALAGRTPEPKELDVIRERFGTSSVMAIYKKALTFSHLTPDAVEQEKKH